MPIYEYQCSACEHEFEQIQKFSDPPASVCPHCSKSGSVTRKLSSSAFILSGGGWYSDGYGKKGGGNGKADSAKSESPGGDAKPSESKAITACGPGCGCAA
jgi:putative FmdB family regulatory protein